LERGDPLIAFDHQVTVRLFSRNDRLLLTDSCQRRQQPPQAFRPAQAKLLKTPCAHNAYEISTSHPELVSRDIPGKSIQRRG
jgi:hypothetical protein